MKRILAYSRGTVLNNLLERAALISSLNQQIKRHLDQDCKDSVQVANYDNGILSLLVDSPSWGTMLRYETPRLLTAFRADGLHGLCNIKILLHPPGPTIMGKVPVPHRPECNPGFANDMFQLCSTIDNPDLRSSLHRLAISIRDQKV